MQNDKETFRRQILLLFVGAFLTGIPTLYITTFQLRYQSRQALRDKQIAVLHDFAASINGGGKIIAKYDALENSLVGLPDTPNPKEFNAIVRQYDEVNLEFENWTANMRTQSIVMESVFGESLPAPEFARLRDIGSSPALNAEPQKEFQRYIKSLEQNIPRLTKLLTEIIDEEQKVLNDVAEQLSKE